EQASSEQTANLHARRFEGSRRLADLCTGIGGDLISLARDHPVLAVDLDPLHLRIAVINASVYDPAADIQTDCVDVRNVDLTTNDGAFVDPARRAGGRRLRLGTSDPPLAWCLSLAERVKAVGIKFAPGIALEQVPDGWEVEFVADGSDLKEAVLWSPALA